MRVATWNVNNVVKRLPLVLDWLGTTRPDVVALQELKTASADFPREAFERAGYRALVAGQRTWNGVALLARDHDPLEVTRTLPGDESDAQARYLEAAIDGVLFAALYLPNGNPWPGEKFTYKMAWFDRLLARAAELWATGQPVVLLGDFNVVPTDADIYRPDSWRDNALLRPEPRAAYAQLLAQGWTDALKATHPTKTPFTFWDYRRQRWQRDAGLRIDHILASAALRVAAAGVDREARGREGASDHAPVWAEIERTTRATRAIRAKREPRSGATSSPPSTTPDALATYNAKRDFSRTSEPVGTVHATDASRARGAATPAGAFVIQKHWASRLHYDFRLQVDGVMRSWAVPKGPSFDPSAKAMAIEVEDHPVSYNDFEGTIAPGQYGAGRVIIWDRGSWEPQGDVRSALVAGKLVFLLHGQKLAGRWELVRISKPGTVKQVQWMLFKKRGDAWARPLSEYDVIKALPDSVLAQPLGLVEERERFRSPDQQRIAAASDDIVPDLSQGVEAPLPESLKPQLDKLLEGALPPGAWLLENKLDGYRLLARVEGQAVGLFTRNGHDWTAKLPGVSQAVQELGLASAWLDGEIVVMSAQGTPDFNALQNSIDRAHAADLVYFVFDLPFLDGRDLRALPLTSRRAALKAVVDGAGGDTVRFSQAFDVPPEQLLAAAAQLGLEGVMAKRTDAPYVSERTETWLKLKTSQRQEFVVVGFVDRAGASGEVGSLQLAYHAGKALRYAGAVGTGWTAATARALHERLSTLIETTPSIDPALVQAGRWGRRASGAQRWVKPTLVVEVSFAEWTPDGLVRHAKFEGLRADKPARAITRERATVGGAASSRQSPSSVKVTHPERIIDPASGLTKLDLVRYYESVAAWILPHLRHRPASLVRAPDGVTGSLFFQKHDESKLRGLTQLDPALWPGHDALLAVDTPQALLSAAQMNVVEFHTWNSVATRINRPDRVVFDLDPGEGVSWAQLQEAAVLMRTLLGELGLESWLKTSGGKGLHVVVPLSPRRGYDEVKGFSHAAVRHMAKIIPSRFVAVAGGSNRRGKIFIDYLRNGHGQTTASAFSARSRPGLGVSMPIAWEQLGEVKSGAQWTIATAREYLSFQKADPWLAYWTCRQTLTRALKTLPR